MCRQKIKQSFKNYAIAGGPRRSKAPVVADKCGATGFVAVSG